MRYDTQGGDNLSRSLPANPDLPGVLPAVSFQKQDIGFEWKDFTPRLGLTYALGPERKTFCAPATPASPISSAPAPVPS